MPILFTAVIRRLTALLPLLLFAGLASAQPASPDGTAAMELVEVNWFEEAMEGGLTMIALALLSLAMVAFAVQHAFTLRPNRIAPRRLADQVIERLSNHETESAVKMLKKDGSPLAETLLYQLEHHQASPERVSETIGDMAGRAITDYEQRLAPLSAIAALAPLLGLLGTMIGMIESFKLVEVFGDEGGASMLAGSISKALITTATGLVIAIPAIVLYYYFKHRLHVATLSLERQNDRLFDRLFVRPTMKSSRKRESSAARPTAPSPPDPPKKQAVTAESSA